MCVSVGVKMDRVRSYFGYKPVADGPVEYAKASSTPSSSKNVERGSGFGFWGKRNNNNNSTSAGGDENASYVREMVSRATSDMLIGSDWALNMEVVDFLNRSDKKLQQSVASALTNRLRYADSHVRDLTLTLTDTCVKNCGTGFHTFLSDAGFGQTLADIVVRNEAESCSPQVRNKMLGYIQEWKDAVSEDAGDFQKAFDTLKFKQNISFPLPKTKSVPINTPPARYATKEIKEEEANQAAIAAILRETTESSQQVAMASSLEHQAQSQSGSSPSFVVFNQGGHHHHTHPAAAFQQGSTTNVVYNVNNLNVRPAQEIRQDQGQRTSGQLGAQQSSSGAVTVAKTVDEELDMISNSCVLLKDMLEAVDNSNKAAIQTALSDDLMTYLLSQCKIGKESSTKWIPSLQDEVTLQKALSLNDDIDFCMMLHESLQSVLESKQQVVDEQPILDHAQNQRSSHDLYDHIFSKRSDSGSSKASAETRFEEPNVNEKQSNCVELEDICIDSKMPAGQSSSGTLVFDVQPDLISFDDSPKKDNHHKAAVGGNSSSGTGVPATIRKQKQIAGTSNSQDTQASRIEDLLSL